MGPVETHLSGPNMATGGGPELGILVAVGGNTGHGKQQRPWLW